MAKKVTTEPVKEFVEPKVFQEGAPEAPQNTSEQFLISKGIDPPIKTAPIQNLTFVQLVDLLDEYKNL